MGDSRSIISQAIATSNLHRESPHFMLHKEKPSDYIRPSRKIIKYLTGDNDLCDSSALKIDFFSGKTYWGGPDHPIVIDCKTMVEDIKNSMEEDSNGFTPCGIEYSTRFNDCYNKLNTYIDSFFRENYEMSDTMKDQNNYQDYLYSKYNNNDEDAMEYKNYWFGDHDYTDIIDGAMPRRYAYVRDITVKVPSHEVPDIWLPQLDACECVSSFPIRPIVNLNPNPHAAGRDSDFQGRTHGEFLCQDGTKNKRRKLMKSSVMPKTIRRSPVAKKTKLMPDKELNELGNSVILINFCLIDFGDTNRGKMLQSGIDLIDDKYIETICFPRVGECFNKLKDRINNSGLDYVVVIPVGLGVFLNDLRKPHPDKYKKIYDYYISKYIELFTHEYADHKNSYSPRQVNFIICGQDWFTSNFPEGGSDMLKSTGDVLQASGDVVGDTTGSHEGQGNIIYHGKGKDAVAVAFNMANLLGNNRVGLFNASDPAVMYGHMPLGAMTLFGQENVQDEELKTINDNILSLCDDRSNYLKDYKAYAYFTQESPKDAEYLAISNVFTDDIDYYKEKQNTIKKLWDSWLPDPYSRTPVFNEGEFYELKVFKALPFVKNDESLVNQFWGFKWKLRQQAYDAVDGTLENFPHSCGDQPHVGLFMKLFKEKLDLTLPHFTPGTENNMTNSEYSKVHVRMDRRTRGDEIFYTSDVRDYEGILCIDNNTGEFKTPERPYEYTMKEFIAYCKDIHKFLDERDGGYFNFAGEEYVAACSTGCLLNNNILMNKEQFIQDYNNSYGRLANVGRTRNTHIYSSNSPQRVLAAMPGGRKRKKRKNSKKRTSRKIASRKRTSRNRNNRKNRKNRNTRKKYTRIR